MTHKAARQLLDALLHELQTTNPSFPTDAVCRLFGVGELRVGLEILCDNLVEAEIAVSDRAKADIESVGSFLGMPSDYWRDITTVPSAS